MATMPNLADYVLTSEAAEILGVSENTVRAWAASGAIPVRRNPANGYRLFKREELMAYLNQLEQPAKLSKRPK